MADDEKRNHEEPGEAEATTGASPDGVEAETTSDEATQTASLGEGRSSDEAEPANQTDDAAEGSATAEAAPPKTRRKTGRKKKPSKTTAGQRLAAAKAAKAAKKAAARGKQAEILEDKATERATVAATWFERNQAKLRNGLLAAMLVLVAIIGWNVWSSQQNAEASRLLWEATETLSAPIVQADEPQDEEDADDEQYESLAARADAALEKLDAMLANHGGSRLAPFALLLRGKALYQKGEYEAAREAYTKALAEGDEAVRPRALEGVAFTFEAEESWDEAMARYEELKEIDGLELLADYHIARVHLARGQEVEAKEKLRAILDVFREEDAPNLPYVRDQAELRLMAIDSSLVQRDATPDADALRRMIQEQLSKQGAQGG